MDTEDQCGATILARQTTTTRLSSFSLGVSIAMIVCAALSVWILLKPV